MSLAHPAQASLSAPADQPRGWRPGWRLEVLFVLCGLWPPPSQRGSDLAVRHPRMPNSNLSSIYDAIIIGGGPAGLTCSIFLARYRRRVLVIDAGKPRNHASHGIHGFLGHHSIKPAELLEKGCAEARLFGV